MILTIDTEKETADELKRAAKLLADIAASKDGVPFVPKETFVPVKEKAPVFTPTELVEEIEMVEKAAEEVPAQKWSPFSKKEDTDKKDPDLPGGIQIY